MVTRPIQRILPSHLFLSHSQLPQLPPHHHPLPPQDHLQSSQPHHTVNLTPILPPLGPAEIKNDEVHSKLIKVLAAAQMAFDAMGSLDDV
ncbi:hypothetical protein Pmani_000347 [Petrolisthes manimaculis]|uniref:Uncharacterized protein n=1 Tax=Petrolisthes manimaculis TaxID=1843537 RepID=A0AAE1ULE7_9EUCA|nr:hypothetical protein Pmani_000347 [Petrolisthes manimaculis]